MKTVLTEKELNRINSIRSAIFGKWGKHFLSDISFNTWEHSIRASFDFTDKEPNQNPHTRPTSPFPKLTVMLVYSWSGQLLEMVVCGKEDKDNPSSDVEAMSKALKRVLEV